LLSYIVNLSTPLSSKTHCPLLLLMCFVLMSFLFKHKHMKTLSNLLAFHLLFCYILQSSLSSLSQCKERLLLHHRQNSIFLTEEIFTSQT
jgi:uncharacterized membrane protein